MRMILNGQQAFGQAVLEALLDRGENIVGVYSAPDKGKPDPLKVAAEERGLPVFQPPSYKDPAVWDQIRSLEPDLCVMAFVTLFVPEEALYIPTHDSIQYHPSPVCLYWKRTKCCNTGTRWCPGSWSRNSCAWAVRVVLPVSR